MVRLGILCVGWIAYGRTMMKFIVVLWQLVLFLLRPQNRVRKLLCNLWTLNFIVLSRRDEVDISLFLADKVYKFSSGNTNYKFLH